MTTPQVVPWLVAHQARQHDQKAALQRQRAHERLRSSEELEELLMTARMAVHTRVTEAMRAAPKATRTR